MTLVKLIFFAVVFSQALIFLEASNKDEAISRFKGEKVEVELQEDVEVVDEIGEELEVLEEDDETLVVDEYEEEVKVEENVEVDIDEVEKEVETVDEVAAAGEVGIKRGLNIVELEDENAEKDKSDGNLSGGLLDARSGEERKNERLDNIRQVEDLREKLHFDFEGEREMEN